MSATIPYDWLKQISHSIVEKDEIPLLYSPGPFPFDKLSSVLAKTFQLESLQINISPWEWRTSDQLTSGFSSPLKVLECQVAPLEGVVTWVMNENEVGRLMALILTKQVQASDIIDSEYENSFFHFIALETLYAFNRIEYDKTLSPQLTENETLPNEDCLCTDVTIRCNNQTFVGRLLLTNQFRKSWKDRYAQRKLEVDLPSSLKEKIHVQVKIEAGHAHLRLSEWNRVKLGDFVCLDHCTFDPDEDKGRVLLVLGEKPIFRAKLKKGELKILEFPLYHEVNTPMVHDDDDDDDFDDFDDTEDFSEEEFDEEFEESHTESVDESIGAPSTPEAPGAAPAEAAPAAPQKKQPPLEPGVLQAQPAVAVKDIPLNVVVEIGRIQLSLQKLSELQAGNVLELDIHPENGVDLTVNGTTIAKGELLKIGETIGIRILDKA